jgi:type I restriction enzyme S subunit
MGLNKYKLGELTERSTANNRTLKYGTELIAGVNNDGVFTVPKGDPIDVDLKPYKIVKDGAFVYNPTRLELGSIAYRTNGLCIVSHLYQVFYLNAKGKELLDPVYLFMFFRRNEFYRQVKFRNFGSQRPEFSYSDMAEIIITLPSIEQQCKFVDVYLSLQKNLEAYQSKVDELKLVCDGYLDKLKKENGRLKIGPYIEQSDLRNVDNKLTIDSLRGISTDKAFIDTKADMLDVSLTNYKIVGSNEFAYVADTSRRGDKVALAFNDSDESYLISSIYTAFKVKDENELDPHYLMMFFTRKEFDRYARFNSWGSARETFDWLEMCDVSIPIPNIDIQRSIASIYKVYKERQAIAAQLKEQLNNLCPILIKGSL